MSQQKSYILPIIILAQFFCTSLWFAGNAIAADLIAHFGFEQGVVKQITSVVQFGFILGTLFYAILAIADRFSPSKVFFASAVLAAVSNALVIYSSTQFQVLLLRFLVGFFLAGIYPVGMKIAADYFEKGLGKALGFLVGALVLGTAFPHLIKSLGQDLAWDSILIITSSLAFIGGLALLLLVPDGPFRKKGAKVQVSQFLSVFKKKKLRLAAFGYFGHMFELYTFWAFVPIILSYYANIKGLELNIPLWSFIIIGIGSLSCVFSGYLSERIGAKKSAAIFLFISGICCLISPVMFLLGTPVFLLFLVIWGIAVIADSPMFSTLVAQNADSETKGTALTLVNSIGFALTIVSIQLLNTIFYDWTWETYSFVILGFGAVFGLFSIRSLRS